MTSRASRLADTAQAAHKALQAAKQRKSAADTRLLHVGRWLMTNRALLKHTARTNT